MRRSPTYPRGQFFRSTVTGTYGPAGALPGSVVYKTYQHSRTLFDVKLQYSFSRSTCSTSTSTT